MPAMNSMKKTRPSKGIKSITFYSFTEPFYALQLLRIIILGKMLEYLTTAAKAVKSTIKNAFTTKSKLKETSTKVKLKLFKTISKMV